MLTYAAVLDVDYRGSTAYGAFSKHIVCSHTILCASRPAIRRARAHTHTHTHKLFLSLSLSLSFSLSLSLSLARSLALARARARSLSLRGNCGIGDIEQARGVARL
jgi:hypothetical protein